MTENGKKMPGSNFQGSINSKIDYEVFKNGKLSRDTIKGWLQNDIRGVYLVLAELLASNELIEAMTEVFWKRYEKLHAAKESQPEMSFDAKAEQYGLKGDAPDHKNGGQHVR